MRRMKQLILLAIIATMVACSVIGSKTLYKAEGEIKAEKIGYAMLKNDTNITIILPKTYEIYKKYTPETFQKYGKELVYIEEEIDYQNVDKDKVSQICKEKGLDALIVPSLEFINIRKSTDLVPQALKTDAKCEMKLFDANGLMVLQVMHETYNGNSYPSNPPADISSQDAFVGSCHLIAKELELEMVAEE